MGFGDPRPPFRPFHNRVRCARCGNEYPYITVHGCRHPAVLQAYGFAPQICVYCCRRKPCTYYKRDPLCGAALCEVANDEGEKQ